MDQSVFSRETEPNKVYLYLLMAIFVSISVSLYVYINIDVAMDEVMKKLGHEILGSGSS